MTKPVCPTGTIYLPEARFKDGRKVKGVCIDTKPVSNKSYDEFLVRTDKTLLLYRGGLEPRAPAVNVSYNGARKYCQSIGMRLPTRDEWKWAFFKSGHSLGMKSGWRGTLREFYETGKPSWAAWIYHSGSFFESGESEGSASDSSFETKTNTFRCAVDPKTYWKNWIVGLGVGLLLLVEPSLIGARFLGLKDPRTSR